METDTTIVNKPKALLISGNSFLVAYHAIGNKVINNIFIGKV